MLCGATLPLNFAMKSGYTILFDLGKPYLVAKCRQYAYHSIPLRLRFKPVLLKVAFIFLLHYF